MPTRRSRIPASRARVLGRDREMASLRDLVLGGEGRLVTVLGIGGVGKTTLAFAVARIVEPELADGAAVVDLTTVTDPASLPLTCCDTLGLLGHALPPTQTLAAYLAPRRMLLILDNVEHLLAPVSELVDLLLDTCPDLVVLVTSRIRLHLRSEVVFPVAPLRVPDESADSGEQAADLPSVALFVQHATAADPDFEPDRWGAQVAEICRSVDGLPLAIELAAAQAAALTPAEILARLSHERALGRHEEHHTARQRTMDATLDWSHELLTEEGRTLFRRLALFSGGCTLDAAVAVCRLEDESWDVAATLALLVDHSLVTREEVSGESRFRMLSPVAEYASRHLDTSGERDRLAMAHAAYYLRLVGTDSAADADWRVVEPEHLELIEREYANIIAGLRFAEGAALVPLVIGFDVSLLLFWRIRGMLRAGVERLEAAAALVGLEATRERGFVLAGLAHFGQLLGLLESAAVHAADAEEVFSGVEDAVAARTVIGFRGDIALDQGDITAARAHYARARAMAVADSDDLDLGFFHANMGRAAVASGEMSLAEPEFREARKRLSAAPGWYRGHVLVQLAGVVRRRGDLSAGRAMLVEAVHELHRYRATLEVISCLRELARLALEQRDDRWAATVVAAATALADRVGVDVTEPERAAQRLEVEMIRSALDPQIFEVAWQTGAAFTLDEAVAFAAGAPVRTSVTRGRYRGLELTARERQIAELVARGMTNRQIADELGIASGTARIHVERILGKLGVGSRVQVATWVTRQQSRGQ